MDTYNRYTITNILNTYSSGNIRLKVDYVNHLCLPCTYALCTFNERTTYTFYPLESTSSTKMELQRGEEVWTDKRRREVCLIVILLAQMRRYVVNEMGNYRKRKDDLIIKATECRTKESNR